GKALYAITVRLILPATPVHNDTFRIKVVSSEQYVAGKALYAITVRLILPATPVHNDTFRIKVVSSEQY
ncbi:hypothetical protein AA109_15545, partial [Listeria monocytogenes]